MKPRCSLRAAGAAGARPRATAHGHPTPLRPQRTLPEAHVTRNRGLRERLRQTSSPSRRDRAPSSPPLGVANPRHARSSRMGPRRRPPRRRRLRLLPLSRNGHPNARDVKHAPTAAAAATGATAEEAGAVTVRRRTSFSIANGGGASGRVESACEQGGSWFMHGCMV